jgi:hypothetical protein
MVYVLEDHGTLDVPDFLKNDQDNRWPVCEGERSRYRRCPDVLEAVCARLDGNYVPNLLGEGAQKKRCPQQGRAAVSIIVFLCRVVARV